MSDETSEDEVEKIEAVEAALADQHLGPRGLEVTMDMQTLTDIIGPAHELAAAGFPKPTVTFLAGRAFLHYDGSDGRTCDAVIRAAESGGGFVHISVLLHEGGVMLAADSLIAKAFEQGDLVVVKRWLMKDR